MSVSYIKLFNQTVDDFFTELIDIFPENNNIKVKYTLFQTIIKTNVKKTCIEFMTQCMPYLEKIAMRDEDFIFGEYSPDFIKDLKLDKVSMSELSENTKLAIWRYIKSFIAIGFNIVEMPVETHDIINYIINYNEK